MSSLVLPRCLMHFSVFVVVLSVFFVAKEGHASGGTLRLKTDGTADGYYYNAGGPGAARFLTTYGQNEFDVTSIICASVHQDLNHGQPPLGTLLIELRTQDPNSPGYADLTPAGLVAAADANSLSECSTTGIPSTATFGGGGGVLHPGSDMAVVALQPANGPGALDFCGLLLDSSSVYTGDAKTQSVAPGGFKETLGFNHFLELVVFDPSQIQMNLRMSGSSRFPSDRGASVVFARRECDINQSDCVSARDNSGHTDDFLTARMTIDNNTNQPATLDLSLFVDRSIINPSLDPKDIYNFMRPIGGGSKADNPITFPPGRTLVNVQLKTALRSTVLNILPLDLDFSAQLTDANDPQILAATHQSRVGFRPRAGYYDDNDVDGANYFTVQLPVMTGDALEVRYDAIDSPAAGNPWRIGGVEVVGAEMGSSGLPGLPAIQLRVEDPILANNPDLSPLGLLRSTGPVTFGPPATTVRVDFTDYVVTPAIHDLAESLWVSALLNPGDSLAGVTTIAGDTGLPVTGNSYTSLQGEVPRIGEPTVDWMMRLGFDDDLDTIDRNRQTRPASGFLRETTRFIPLGRFGERITE